MESVTLNVQVDLRELARVMCELPERRVDAMVRQHGEVCTIVEASKMLSVTPRTVYTMLRDGRLRSACEGEKVDVRSIASYIDGDHGKRKADRLRV